MKKITILFTFLSIITIQLAHSQGTSVPTAEPFCSGGSELEFPNVSGQPDTTEVGCLGTIPNSAYYYLTIDQPGNLIFTISQEDNFGFPIDVDFIAWGPFASIADADAAISLTDCLTCPNNTTNPNFYPYAPDLITDCSYDIAPTETLTINGALSGQIYIVLITNYDNSPGTISLQQTSGNGTTSCDGIPACGGNYTDSGGDTGNYSNNENQTTTVYPTVAGGTVIVDFTLFDVVAGDILTVYDGPTSGSPSLGNVTTAPSTFTSTDPSGALTFEFTSNASGVSTGWEADVTCTTPPTCAMPYYDSGGLVGNYSDYETQISTFYPDTAGDALTVNFTAFNTENNYDYLYIYSGENITSPLLAILTGTAVAPASFTSTDPSGALTFRFTSDSSVTRPGWEANFTCSPYVPPSVCGSTFYDSGGNGGNYFDNELTITTLTPDIPGTSVTATFTFFDLEDCCDELRIYDGPDATYPLLGTYNATAPPVWTSTDPSGALTFVFESDGSITSGGWAADITCIDLCNLIITDTIYPIGADSCNLDYTELTTNATPTFTPTTVFSETFNGSGLPTGWAINNGSGGGSWSITNSSNAGGASNEATLAGGFNTTANGNRTITSSVINVTGQTNLQLNFKQYLDHYLSSYVYSIFVETNLDNAGWVTQYSVMNVSNDINPETRNIDLIALSGNNLRIRFRLNGRPFGLNYWYIDDITITAAGTTTPPQITWTPSTELYTDTALTTPYVGGSYAETVYAAPNGFQTYLATDNNGCDDTVDVQHDKKVWNGSDATEGTNWYIPSNWTPSGVPTSTNCVVIPNPTQSNGNSPIVDIINLIPLPPQPALARNLTVQNNGFLEIESNTSIEVVDWVNVNANGLFLLKDSASLVQITEGAPNTNNNTGVIHMQRNVGSITSYDYIYWSSPVENYAVSNVSPGSSHIYEWIPTIVGNGAGNYGNWQATTETMQRGKGYIIRNVVGTTIPLTPEFIGRPNNGIITKAITRGGYNGVDYTGAGNTMATALDDNWNLVGNPYPSAISADAFLTANASLLTGDVAPIEGTVYLWRHLAAPSNVVNDPFYEDYVYNYNPNDYIAYNSTGSNPVGFSGNIAAGQSFFVLMEHSPPIASNVTFNNDMRSAALDNSQFYRTSTSENTSTTSLERHRIWLDLIAADNSASSTLVGYIENATNDKDRLFDAYDLSENSAKLYSLIGDEELSIQGRVLPFVDTDKVPMGITVNQDGNYTIAINTLDGLFESTNQTIYLEDTYNNTIHDLRTSPFTFTSDSGTFNDRFILRYTNDVLSLNQFETSGLTIIAPNGDYIKIKSENNPITYVIVYDLLGRVLIDKQNINATTLTLTDNNLSDGTYIVKATLSNNQFKIQKIILKQ